MLRRCSALSTASVVRKPEWLRMKSLELDSPEFRKYEEIKKQIQQNYKLSTVCEEAKCPNIAECWGGGTATIMLMGDTCTRGCRFCAVKTSRTPPPLDIDEPGKVAEIVSKWGINYIVLTSVDRDDLPDQGSIHLSKCISKIKELSPKLLIEALLPDFRGDTGLIDRILSVNALDVYAHNVETVERLTQSVRDRRAGYRQSLSVLEYVSKSGKVGLTKTSIMLGLGETDDEIRQSLRDLRTAGVNVVTFGQYLQPTKYHMKVYRYVTPAEFEQWREEALALGFDYCASGPMVRSSYRAGEYYLENLLKNRGKPGMAVS